MADEKNIKLEIRKYEQEGDLAHEYQPLRNYINKNNEIVGFEVSGEEWPIDLTHPVDIECQPSYDGTVNLIINDDYNPPRIINTRFSKIEDNRYKIINRNQKEQTNLYKEGKIDQQTRLFRNINTIPKIDLINVSNIGQLMGGNYTFYIKFADNDYNKTDVVAESGIVSIFKGYENKVNTISGTIFDERTDKAVTLKISNVDTSFSKIYVYYIRETCDQNGFRITKAGVYTVPYEIKNDTVEITINGFEEEQELTPEEINIKYNIVTATKSQAQVQNMLFFGNVQEELLNVKELQNISYFIKVRLCQKTDSIGYISTEDYTQKDGDDVSQSEYYSTHNIYYNLGYWPDEIYRLGIVYILKDDSITPVFNLRGHNFTTVNANEFNTNEEYDKDNPHYLERDDFLEGTSFLDNTFGVFKTPCEKPINSETVSPIIANNEVKPWYFEMTVSQNVREALSYLGVKGFFFVRQKRIPTNLCQGFSVGIDRISHVPLLARKKTNSENYEYFTESFLTKNCTLSGNFEDRIITTENKQGSGLLCLDAAVNTQLQSYFDGTSFVLKPVYKSPLNLNHNKRHYYINNDNIQIASSSEIHTSVVFIDTDTPMKYINGNAFSTRCGVAEDVSKFAWFSFTDKSDPKTNKILRGVYTSFLGVSTTLSPNMMYTIKVPNYSSTLMKDYFLIRGKDNAPFYAISDRYDINYSDTIDCYRGDCYTNTVTIRMNRNFVDSEVPVNDIIINPDTWKDNYKGYNKMKDSGDDVEEDKKEKEYGYFSDINRADVNTVPLGMWVTYKCLSNYNLGLRTVDTSYTDEYALMGSPRSFYPVSDMFAAAATKVNESALLNDGYNATVGQKRNFIVDNVPYIKELFDNRIMFSNVQRDDDFQNAYRIFQGLSFKDIDRQYGAIVKLLPYNNNLFCVFEHGLGIIPINEKALIQTGTGQSIHMYGAGVIQNQITLISPDFGSIWQESIIRTPVGIYGVDTYAKKIWRFSDKGLETISDMKVQRFLNDNIKLAEKEKYPIISIRNVKSHFNNFKGDVMFTFYNFDGGTTWNLCYNERMNKWITRYSWTPLYSENINNIFYSFDQDRAKILAHIYDNKNCNYGLSTVSTSEEDNSNVWTYGQDYSGKFYMKGYIYDKGWNYTITSIESELLINGTKTSIIITDNLFNFGKNGEYDTINANFAEVNEYFNREHQGSTIPTYFKVNIVAEPIDYPGNKFYEVLGIVVKNHPDEDSKRAFLRNGVYVHGKAGIFNEIDYRDKSFENEILPTKWYEKQEPFEFEFVVNDEVGLHKIFDNLVIISNNVQPNQIEYEIIGDVYKFNKTGIFRSNEFDDPEQEWNNPNNKPKIITWKETRTLKPGETATYQASQDFVNKCTVVWDDVLNQYSLRLTQDCKNIAEYGRRLGNIYYKEDSWYTTIEPIRYTEKYKIKKGSSEGIIDELPDSKVKEARIRDKFVKIRVKYTGEDMVIITALKTTLTPSYS